MNLIKNQPSTILNRILNIFFNIITLNKLPMKGSFIYFLLLLLGIISSIIIRYFYMNKLILPFPEYINNCIILISILYSFFLFFNYLIITAHAFKLIDFFFIEQKKKLYNNNINMIFIGYYIYYLYITLVTSFVVTINYYSFLKLNILNINFYIFFILLIFNLACYFIINIINFNYDINKKLEFIGKLCLFTFFSLFLLYLYFIYSGLLFKFFNFCSPFKTIYCETSSAEAASELNRNLLNTSNDEGKTIEKINNSNNHNSTNLNHSSNNSNIGNNHNNNTTGIQSTNTNNDQQPTNTNLTTTTRTETHTYAYTIQNNNNNNNFSDENLPFLDSRSSTPTPTNTRTHTQYIQQTILNKTSQSKYSN
jgi:hypothetical protein